MDDRQTERQRNEENKALATADLAGIEPPDEIWPKAHNGGTKAGAKGMKADRDERIALLPTADCDRIRREWDSIQAGFVDEPRSAVEHADNLVATTMKHLAETFAAERSRLEGAWDRAAKFRRKTCASRCSATARSSTVC